MCAKFVFSTNQEIIGAVAGSHLVFSLYIPYMGYEALIDYDFYSRLQDKALDIVGQPCTVWVPKQQVTLGYEDLGKWVEQWTGVSRIANSFQKFQAKIWIEFNIKRSVAYHFNIDPNAEENSQLVMATLPTTSLVREGAFVRTSVPDGVSVWGDLVFVVTKVVDEGQFKTLKRTYFLRPVVAAELNSLLDVGGD